MSVYSSTVKKFETAAQINGKLVFAMEGPISTSPHYIREPLPALQSPRTVFSISTTAKALDKFSAYLCSDTVLTWCVEPRMAGLTLLLPNS